MMPQKAWSQSIRILSGGRFLSSAGLTGISPFIPYYMEHMNVGTPEEVLMWTGLSVSAPALSYALLTPLWGKLGDRWSRKWMVVRALVGLSLSMFLMGVAQTPFQFFLFRLCQGAFGGISDASSAFVGSHAPPAEQGRSLGQLERASAAGLLVGPLLGSICVATWGSRPLLFITASLTIGFALLASLALGGHTERGRSTAAGESGQDNEPTPVAQGAVSGSGPTPAALEQTSVSVPTLTARTQASASLSAPASPVESPEAAGKATDRRSGIFEAFRSLLSHAMTRRLILAGIMFKLVDFATFTMFTPYMRELHSAATAALMAGFLLATSSFGELVGAPWWGRRNDRHAPERNLRLAGLLYGLCLLAHLLPLGVAWLVALRFLTGFFFSALLQTVMLHVLRSSTEQDRGVRIGATNSLLMAGQLTGPSLGVWIGGLWSIPAVFLVMGLVMLAVTRLVPRSYAPSRQEAMRLPLQ
ncbi:putative MFS transporter [Paenibacillus sp. 598K]|uniref:MFS transporter n=1 Tax=Paenibacillus sp. 598K TaxID=1117987 RepID=UPI000FFAB17B|nr:MFS transporter [Paenibacillus sp. 598K]GBF76060.1 putative MFS transporter [Paenibacillus sp. 598K]